MSTHLSFLYTSTVLSLILALAANLSTGKAADQGPPAAALAVINEALDAFNAHDSKGWNSAYGGNVVIVDGMAPYRWVGPTAPAEWWADEGRWSEANGITKLNIANKGIGGWGVSGTRAYISVLATLTLTQKGKEISRRGTLTFTLANVDGVWRAEGFSWGNTAGATPQTAPAW
jgi:hypothetical protein